VNFTQPLFRGFGFALNNRFIRIAKNDRQISDLMFEQQAIATVSAVVRLYWDLVSLNEDLRVKQQTLDVSNQLLTNNRQSVEAGTLAPIEVVRAQAEVARSRRDVLVSDTLVRQEETIMKDFLTRNTVYDPLLAGVHIIPTDVIRLPDTDPVQPVQDMISSAYTNRPDLRQARIQLENSNISLKGSKSALLPEIDFIANVNSNALYGQVNAIPPVSTGGVTLTRSPNPDFLGGFGSGLAQIFRGNFPDYGVGLQVNIPIGNRAAIADVVRDKLTVRQQEIRLRQLEKQVQVDVQNALIAVQQARSTYQAALQARELQQQSLEAEQQKYQVGLSTNYNVIQAQRDLSQARSDEVLAMGDYAKAHATLERALGTILTDFNISVEDAYRGTIPSKPTPPAVTTK
jgi:outer membrane protein TolC